MLSGLIKILLIHVISLISGALLWIYIYINGMEQYELTLKLNVHLPQNYITIGRNNDIPIKAVVETNRKYREHLNNNYTIEKNINIKGRLFPKKVTIKISESDIQLPKIFKIINIVDKNISINCDVLKEVILPLQLQSVTYKGNEIKNYTTSIEPDYISVKVPSGFARINKAIYISTINLNELPTKPVIFNMPIPKRFQPYLQEKIHNVSVTINVHKPIIENTISTPIKLLILPQAIQSKIKTLKVYPDSVQVTIQYPDNISLSSTKKNTLCYVEIKNITHPIQIVPIFCIVKSKNLKSKIKIIDISKTSAKVKMSKKKK